MNFDPILPYLNFIKAGAAVLCAGLLFVGGCNHGASKWEGKYDTEVAARKADKASHKAVIAGLADLTRIAADKAKAASKQASDDRKANDQRFKDSEHEADQAKRELARALRAGTVRLRDEWACPAPRASQGGAAGTASRQDAGADLRAAGAASLVAAGDAADRWIGWLQAELISTRTACGVTR